MLTIKKNNPSFDFKQLADGALLLIDKPIKWTTFDVVKYIKCSFLPNKIKVGHAGTLDPLATGLVLVCTGKSTKEISQYTTLDKEYVGTFCLGATTPSFDLETTPENEQDISQLTESEIIKNTHKFVGNISQKPPIYSAVKQQGQKLYNIARKGGTVEIRERPVEVYSFDITDIRLPIVSFKIKCSKGTYIRSIAHDFGQSLLVGAYLHSLKRTRIGVFALEDAIPIHSFRSKIIRL